MTPRNRKEYCAFALERLSRAGVELAFAAATDGTPDSLPFEERLKYTITHLRTAEKYIRAALAENVTFP